MADFTLCDFVNCMNAGIYVTNTWSGCFIDTCFFMALNYGVYAEDSMMVEVTNCPIIDSCWNTGIHYDNVGGGSWIQNNVITNCGIGIEQIESTSQIMDNTVSNGMMDGFRISGGISGIGPAIIDNNEIFDFGMSGISCMGADVPTISNNHIHDNMGDAILMFDSQATISNNGIYGWNATLGSGMPGTNGIFLGGTSLIGVEITGNTIMGGNGDDFIFMPGDGGHAIWANNFEGNSMGWPQLSINNNTLLRGGHGGDSPVDDMFAGTGGDAIRVDCIPDTDPGAGRKALEIVDNVQIVGGNGGDNTCLFNGAGGNGGYGIRIVEDDFIGSQKISDNLLIHGGDGGYNFADDTEAASNWACGNGGDGLFIQDACMGVPTDILDNPHIEGGQGGNADGIGQFKKAGMGGDGINLVACDNTFIDQTLVFGGDGGDNTGTMIMAGDGGDGILIGTIADRFSNVNMDTVNGTGGEGGDNYVSGGPGGGGAGTGGDGLEVNGGSMAMSMSSNYNGGKGGDTYADMDMGGMGGYGIQVWDASMLNAFVGTIIGGDGGDSRYAGPPGGGTMGGSGGIGVRAMDAMTFFDIVGHYIAGGAGGDNHFDFAGMAGYGGDGVSATNMDMVQLMDSEIEVGPAGIEHTGIGIPGGAGITGVDINTVSMGAMLDNITVHGAQSFGVFFGQTGGMLTNSEIYNSGMGATSCGVMALMSSDPLIADNRVHNCTSGILVGTNSNPDIVNNVVENSQFYGMYIYGNSHPHIDRTVVDNSGEYAMRLIGGTTSLVENCTISNSGIADWYVDQDSHPVSLNTTSDKTVVINDALSNLTMNWFMHTKVVDSSFVPVAGANIWINDTFGGNSGSRVSDANGWANWTVITEFIEDQAGRIYYTNHNGTAISGLQTGWALPEPFMDGTQSVTIVLGLPAWNLYLDPGWNLISLPLIPGDTTYSEVLKSIDGQWDKIYVYNNTHIGSNIWMSNNVYYPSFNEVTDLYHTQGIWIHTNAPAPCLTVIGSTPVSTTIMLYAGWNLVGYPSFTSMQADTALIGTNYDGLAECDMTEPSLLRDMLGTDMMHTGKGYWVHVPTDTVWTVDW